MADLGKTNIHGDIHIRGNTYPIGGLRSQIFSDGFNGQGFSLYKDNQGKYSLTVDSLRVRGSMNVYEFIVNKMQATNGILIVSDSAKIESIVGTNITLEGVNPFLQGDILRCQVFNGSHIKSVTITVSSVSNRVIGVNSSSNLAPGDLLVRIGSTNNSNRKGTIWLDSSTSRPKLTVISDLDSVSSSGIDHVVLGHIGNKVFNGVTIPSNTYGLYTDNAYLSGSIVSTNGKIGNWNITGSSIQTGNYNTANTMYFGASGISLGTTFRVSTNGSLTATSGTIGGWTITNQISNGNVILASNGTILYENYWRLGYDGSGYVAKTNISWTSGGAVTIGKGNSTINISNTGAITLGSAVTIGWGAVTGTSGAITGTQISSNAITTTHIGANQIITQAANIKDAVITNAKISDLNANKINAGTISADRIAVGSISANKLAINSITSTYIQNGAIGLDQLHVDVKKLLDDAFDSDTVLTPSEKQSVLQIWSDIESTHQIAVDAANHYQGNPEAKNITSEIEALSVAYNTVYAYLFITIIAPNTTPLLGDINTSSTVDANALRQTISYYYTCYTNLEKVKGSTIINGGYLQTEIIKTNSIHADKIVANSIEAKHIKANSITSGLIDTTNLIVKDTAKIGNFTIIGGVLTATNVGLSSTGIWLGGSSTNAPFRVTSAGAVTATSGNIAGWRFDHDSIYCGQKQASNAFATSGITIHSTGAIRSKNFRIDTDGNAFFNGHIVAASGTIGGFNIKNNHLTYSKNNVSCFVGEYTDLYGYKYNGFSVKAMHYDGVTQKCHIHLGVSNDDIYGLQCLDDNNSLVFSLGSREDYEGDIETGGYIAGWKFSFDTGLYYGTPSQNYIKIGPTELVSTYHNTDGWKLRCDGSGFVANGAIEWDKYGGLKIAPRKSEEIPYVGKSIFINRGYVHEGMDYTDSVIVENVSTDDTVLRLKMIYRTKENAPISAKPYINSAVFYDNYTFYLKPNTIYTIRYMTSTIHNIPPSDIISYSQKHYIITQDGPGGYSVVVTIDVLPDKNGVITKTFRTPRTLSPTQLLRFRCDSGAYSVKHYTTPKTYTLEYVLSTPIICEGELAIINQGIVTNIDGNGVYTGYLKADQIVGGELRLGGTDMNTDGRLTVRNIKNETIVLLSKSGAHIGGWNIFDKTLKYTYESKNGNGNMILGEDNGTYGMVITDDSSTNTDVSIGCFNLSDPNQTGDLLLSYRPSTQVHTFDGEWNYAYHYSEVHKVLYFTTTHPNLSTNETEIPFLTASESENSYDFKFTGEVIAYDNMHSEWVNKYTMEVEMLYFYGNITISLTIDVRLSTGVYQTIMSKNIMSNNINTSLVPGVGADHRRDFSFNVICNERLNIPVGSTHIKIKMELIGSNLGRQHSIPNGNIITRGPSIGLDGAGSWFYGSDISFKFNDSLLELNSDSTKTKIEISNKGFQIVKDGYNYMSVRNSGNSLLTTIGGSMNFTGCQKNTSGAMEILLAAMIGTNTSTTTMYVTSGQLRGTLCNRLNYSISYYRTGSNSYRAIITHNLGHTNYVVYVANINGEANTLINIESKTEIAFSVSTLNASGSSSYVNRPFYFIMYSIAPLL